MLNRLGAASLRLFSGPKTLYPEGRDQPRLYLLDAGRGFAALAVLFFHYRHFFVPPGQLAGTETGMAEPLYGLLWPLFEHGDLAVPIFWMISGFVFSNVYYGTGATAREFFANRFARLYPLHFLTLCLVLLMQSVAAARLGGSLLFGHNDLPNFALQLAFASNWFSANQTFNGPIWSVSVEVLIYAVFWLTRGWLPKFGVLLPMTLAALLLPVAVIFSENQVAPCGVYFFFGTALAGVVSAFSKERPLLWLVAAALMLAGVAGFATGSHAIGRGVGVPGLFGGLIILLVIVENAAPQRARPLLAMIGDNTYGMYLWHVPFQFLVFLALAGTTDVARLAASPWFLLFYLASVIVMARLGFVFYERPMRNWLRRFGGPPRVKGPKIAAP